MHKFLTNSVLFLLPLLVATICVFFVSVDKHYAYYYLTMAGAEGRAPWLYNKIFKDTASIDIAFIGTSHTMNAVNDSLVEVELRKKGLPLSVCNLAFMTFGRNWDYVVIKDLLEHKKVKCIILEIRENEAGLGHGSFHAIASTRDLLCAPIAFNRSYFPDLYKGWFMHLQYLRESTTGEYVKREKNLPTVKYGYNGGNANADIQTLKAKAEDVKIKKAKGENYFDKGFQKYAMKYVALISDLCKANNCTLYFLYLPAYGYNIAEKKISATYAAYGEVVFVDTAILKNTANWADHEHLNTNASTAVAEKVVQALAKDSQ